uniref:Disease resistance protein At4g27190-like leucine-rich repeats domain-containing protein n=1 Tax=Aegilops tauschii TaxID=37682 RepID=N1QPV8_AEGTA
MTAIPPTNWGRLEWCHVERCPKLNYVFSRRKGTYSFQCIKIFSASDLPVAYCIWGGINKTWGDFYYSHQSLQQLQHIYLYNCPRLVLVLTISFTLPNLETLQIAYCSSLRHVFPVDDKYPTEIASGVTFKNLKDIKLHHLHKLEQICEARLTAPALQTVGIRDCWALKRLPAVACDGPKPVVDCEKDMWDKLEWDGLDAGHHPSLFETRHSTYHKKTLPRGSYLSAVLACIAMRCNARSLGYAKHWFAAATSPRLIAPRCFSSCRLQFWLLVAVHYILEHIRIVHNRLGNLCGNWLSLDPYCKLVDHTEQPPVQAIRIVLRAIACKWQALANITNCGFAQHFYQGFKKVHYGGEEYKAIP